MKQLILFVVAALAVGASASPRDVQGRFVDGIIGGIFDDLVISIQESGLDPYSIENERFEYKLPVTDLLDVQAEVVDFLVEGLSNIVLENVNFSLLQLRLRFTVRLPRLALRLGSASASARIASTVAGGGISGSLSISEINVAIDARISLSGLNISVRSVEADLRVPDVQSNLNVELFNENLTEDVNNFLNNVIPEFIANYRNDLNELISFVLLDVLDDIL